MKYWRQNWKKLPEFYLRCEIVIFQEQLIIQKVFSAIILKTVVTKKYLTQNYWEPTRSLFALSDI